MSNPPVRIVPELCRGCTLCVKACPFGAIRMSEGKAVIDYDRCTFCGACVPVCKRFGAIVGDSESAVSHPAVPCGNVCVFCEREGPDGPLLHVAAELLGRARLLAATLGVGVDAILLGNKLETCAREAIAAGADRVLLAEDPVFESFEDQVWAAALRAIIEAYSPEILLGGATAVGRALLPRVAVEIHTGLTADCTELSIDPESGLLLQTRPAFGGNILATITCEHRRPQMATVRPGVLPRLPADQERQGEIVRCRVPTSLPGPILEWLDFLPRAQQDADVREADIVVTAGYGVGGPDGVALVAELARALGGVVGASRAVVDAGWLPYVHQVGQTGSTVQPKLYVACGVSGAIQHIVGMQSSERIIAINRDPEAPIFGTADYAVVGDLFEVIPAVLSHLSAAPAAR